MIMNINDVSQQTLLSEATIRRLVKRGAFPNPATLTGRRRVWSEEAIYDWIEQRLAESGGVHHD